ncbi:hypothetical protein [Aurantiacibacter spongiae]|uniref:Uncharacterized protein n=1 Tax=Aurantiacibacter spongiae TaxID=2488860 RepID=A0A3N5CSX0_9SPHN|nr:hypothetical protein [Aurantiacibacter spongiae]RPF70440.1 hypothetical protein EG799_01455 [Aurantiacibacter spongiae]
MIHAQTPDGKKNFLLRGANTPRGDVTIAKVSVLTPQGDKVVWDITGSGGSSGLTGSAAPGSVSGAGASSQAIEITTNETAVSVAGAAGSVSYSWAKTAGADTWSIHAPLSNRTRFSSLGLNTGESRTATFTCTIRDASGRTATVDVTAFVINYGDPRGDIITP